MCWAYRRVSGAGCRAAGAVPIGARRSRVSRPDSIARLFYKYTYPDPACSFSTTKKGSLTTDRHRQDVSPQSWGTSFFRPPGFTTREAGMWCCSCLSHGLSSSTKQGPTSFCQLFAPKRVLSCTLLMKKSHAVCKDSGPPRSTQMEVFVGSSPRKVHNGIEDRKPS